MRCPVCKAENDGTTCRRCKADLSLLIALEQARDAALSEAARAVTRGDGVTARQHAETAHRLRAADDSSRLLAVACLQQRDFARALTHHRSRSVEAE